MVQNGSVKGRNFTGDSFKAGDNVLSNTTLQIGPTTGSNNVTITRDGLTAKLLRKLLSLVQMVIVQVVNKLPMFLVVVM